MFTPKAAIFDFDGTLADSMWVWEQVDRDFMASRGIEYRRDYAEAIAALGFEGSADFFIEQFSLDETPEQLIEEWKQMASGKYAHDVRLKEGAEQYLRALKDAGTPLAIATTLQRMMLVPALINNNVYELFDAVVICEEVCEGGKSTPRVFEIAAERLGTALPECAVFEDVAQAAASAKRGGAFVVGLFDGNAQQNIDSLRTTCDLYVEGYDELIRMKG